MAKRAITQNTRSKTMTASPLTQSAAATRHFLAAKSGAALMQSRSNPVAYEIDFKLATLPGAYASLCEGDCMLPVIHDGDTVVVEPILPKASELAVFWFRGQQQPVLKRLISPLAHIPSDPSAPEFRAVVVAEQINPTRSYYYSIERLEAAHRVHSVIGPSGKPKRAGQLFLPPPSTPTPDNDLIAVYDDPPKNLSTFAVPDDGWAPLLRRGEIAIIDTALAAPEDRALVLKRYESVYLGESRVYESIVRLSLPDQRRYSCSRAQSRKHPRPWWKMLSGRQKVGNFSAAHDWWAPGGYVTMADGPISEKFLRPMIVGRVVGVVPARRTLESSVGVA